jgi:hypothetical protein
MRCVTRKSKVVARTKAEGVIALCPLLVLVREAVEEAAAGVVRVNTKLVIQAMYQIRIRIYQHHKTVVFFNGSNNNSNSFNNDSDSFNNDSDKHFFILVREAVEEVEAGVVRVNTKLVPIYQHHKTLVFSNSSNNNSNSFNNDSDKH